VKWNTKRFNLFVLSFIGFIAKNANFVPKKNKEKEKNKKSECNKKYFGRHCCWNLFFTVTYCHQVFFFFILNYILLFSKTNTQETRINGYSNVNLFFSKFWIIHRNNSYFFKIIIICMLCKQWNILKQI